MRLKRQDDGFPDSIGPTGDGDASAGDGVSTQVPKVRGRSSRNGWFLQWLMKG